MVDTDGPQRRWLVAALAVAVLAVGVLLAVVAVHRPAQPPVAVGAVPAPHGDDPACAALLTGLPDRLGDLPRARLAEPAPPGAAAWRADRGEPVVLRCGLGRPAEFVVGSPLIAVDAVQWFEAGEQDRSRSTWYAVDRPVYVALTLPSGSGPTPIQQLSALIGDTLAAVPIDPAPAR